MALKLVRGGKKRKREGNGSIYTFTSVEMDGKRGAWVEDLLPRPRQPTRDPLPRSGGVWERGQQER